ncbi:hypothetical protein l11_09730 [Neisseria weaveri LMG 5135]|nr:hypothetical protein l11_09730 [Neisseria weaveri LMG 5135]
MPNSIQYSASALITDGHRVWEMNKKQTSAKIKRFISR